MIYTNKPWMVHTIPDQPRMVHAIPDKTRRVYNMLDKPRMMHPIPHHAQFRPDQVGLFQIYPYFPSSH